jgi:hypothetical protein
VAVRIEDAGDVVVEETAGQRRQPGPPAGAVLDPGERARQARRNHQHQPGHGDHLPRQHLRPPPRCEAAEDAERQEPEVGGDRGVRDGFEEHTSTVASS